jgi:hypothetical protein
MAAHTLGGQEMNTISLTLSQVRGILERGLTSPHESVRLLVLHESEQVVRRMLLARGTTPETASNVALRLVERWVQTMRSRTSDSRPQST